ncbi:Adenylate cyclase type 10, partial [Chytridiales sp. JEL 0842]
NFELETWWSEDTPKVEMESSRVSVESYLSQYARLLAQDSRRLGNLKASLKSGNAFVEKGFCAVAMIDISKYSKITSSLAQFGMKVASEIMTQSVGVYLKQIIDVVAMYHGDIVKFLGDALLIAFHPLNNDEQHASIVERAIVCCSHIIERHSLAKVTTKILNLNSSSSPQADERPSSSYDTKGSVRSSAGDFEDQDLRLHIAVTAGEIQNIVVGNYDERLDYCIGGECLSALDIILKNAKPGELGIDANIVDLMKSGGMYMNLPQKISSDKPVILTGNQLLEAMNLHQDDARSTPLPGEVNVGTKEKDLNDEDLAKLYMTKTSRQTTVKSFASERLDDRDGQMDLMARFVNKALFHKLKANTVITQSEPASNSTNTNIGEFRNITVVFCKLNFEFDAKKSQKVMVLFLNALDKCGGTFQQYSIDDKGQTMLAVFGLPPYTHTNEPMEAAKAVA